MLFTVNNTIIVGMDLLRIAWLNPN